MTGIERLHEIMTRLRDPQTGCPWDRVQTLETLKPCVLEETYELLAAMDKSDDRDNHIEELGDVLLQVMFQSVMAEQEGSFTFDDVANAIADKLVHRHPHVFGDVVAKDAATVLRNWERLKQMEHKKEARRSALDGVPPALPALLKARRTMEKAKRIGYEEPLKPVAIEGDPGEFLLRVVKSIADRGVDSESALEKATAAFAARFRRFEAEQRKGE
jgi:MazG family protein